MEKTSKILENTRRVNDYNILRGYFQHIAENSKWIKDFAGFMERELREKTNSFSGIPSPFLHLWKYEKGYLGDFQPTIAVINCGYVIMRNDVDINDFEAIYTAVDECETIAHHVNSRIRRDSNDPKHFLFNSYMKDRTRVEPVYMDEVGYGVEVQVYFKNPQPIQFEPTEWLDNGESFFKINLFGNPLKRRS